MSGQQSATTVANAATGEQAAIEFVTGNDAGEDSPLEPVLADDSAPGKPEAKPETKTPEAILTEAEEARTEASARLEKVNSQNAARERRARKIDEREAQLVEREKRASAIDSLVSVSDIAQHLASKRGVAIDEIWKEWGEEFQNGGKPSEATLAKRERDQLKRERDEQKALTEKREAEQREATQQQWGNDMDTMLSAGAFKETYPRLAAIPQKIMIDALVNNVDTYRKQTGNLPSHAELLAWMESQCPEAAPAAPVAETLPKKKATVLSNRDVNAPANARELTESEREELAIDFVSSLG